MHLIADSGSTKTDWRLLTEGQEAQQVHTAGINPYFHEAEDIHRQLIEEWPEALSPKTIANIHFYGAGASSPQRQATVKKGLQQFFPQATINVFHDLLGAARAACGRKAGITAILGTGSNSCYYDGQQIVREHGGHGYILSDEGGGNHLGKELINAYLDDDLPAVIRKSFEEKYDPDPEAIIHHIYQEENPSRYLARFAQFLSDHRSNEFVHELILWCFTQFFDKHIVQYNNYQQLPFHAVGSIGYYFSDILEDVIAQQNMTRGNIIQAPIEGLVQFHLNND